jgi:hypothetical protein
MTNASRILVVFVASVGFELGRKLFNDESFVRDPELSEQ